MSATPKPRCDSRLKNLPQAVQDELWQWMNGREGYRGAKRLMAEQHGVETSRTALSYFYSWYPLQKPLEEARNFADEVKEILKELPTLNLAEEKVNLVGQAIFEHRAVKEKDFKQFVQLRKLRQKDSETTLEREKFELMRKKAEQADRAQQVTESGASPEEKERQMKAIFGLT